METLLIERAGLAALILDDFAASSGLTGALNIALGAAGRYADWIGTSPRIRQRWALAFAGGA